MEESALTLKSIYLPQLHALQDLWITFQQILEVRDVERLKIRSQTLQGPRYHSKGTKRKEPASYHIWQLWEACSIFSK